MISIPFLLRFPFFVLFVCFFRTVGVALGVDMDSLLPSTVADLILACNKIKHTTKYTRPRLLACCLSLRLDLANRAIDKTGSGQTEVFLSHRLESLSRRTSRHATRLHTPATGRQTESQEGEQRHCDSQSGRQTGRQTATAAPLAAVAAAAPAAAPLAAPPAAVAAVPAAGAMSRTGHRVGPGGDVREEHDAHIQ
jgi:hypothetical protein